MNNLSERIKETERKIIEGYENLSISYQEIGNAKKALEYQMLAEEKKIEYGIDC